MSRKQRVSASASFSWAKDYDGEIEDSVADDTDGEDGGVDERDRVATAAPKAGGRPSPSASTNRRRTKNELKKRDPPFPRGAYHLARDERMLKHNYVSFIDHAIGSSYTEIARLVEPRRYARSDQFDGSGSHGGSDGSSLQRQRQQPLDMITIDDVAPPATLYGPVAKVFAWNGLPARAVVGACSWFAFPYIIAFLEQATHNIEPQDLATLVDTFLPGVAIVLGCYFSLTLSILYDRFANLQEIVSLEAAALSVACYSVLDLFSPSDEDEDEDAAVECAQCVADQVGTMVRDSRGRETMAVVYSDPYARMLAIVNDRDAKGNLDKVSALQHPS